VSSRSVTHFGRFRSRISRHGEMSYDENWRDLRTRIRLFWFVWLSGVPLLAIIIAALERIFPKTADLAGVGLAIAWMVAFFVAGIYRQAFKCPRCGKRYFSRWLYHNPYARKCLHCGLRRWSPAVNDSN
jgi:uncharacterized membrane protein